MYFLVCERLGCRARGNGKVYGSRGRSQDCKFPFIHDGKRYRGCAVSSGGKGPWCATKVDSKGNLKRWARCNKYCKKEKGM